MIQGPAIFVNPLGDLLMALERLDPDSPPRLDPADYELFLLAKFIVQPRLELVALTRTLKFPLLLLMPVRANLMILSLLR